MDSIESGQILLHPSQWDRLNRTPVLFEQDGATASQRGHWRPVLIPGVRVVGHQVNPMQSGYENVEKEKQMEEGRTLF